jgi:hypothetical protein
MKLRSYSKQALSNYSDEYYTSKKQVKDAVERVIIDPSWKILCPFDTEQSKFVKYLKSKGYNVTYLKEGQVNTDYNPEDYDITITNPPWRNFTRLYSDYLDRAPRFVLILSWTLWWAIEKHQTRDMKQIRTFAKGKYRSTSPRIPFKATNSDKTIDCFYLYKGFTNGNDIIEVEIGKVSK